MAKPREALNFPATQSQQIDPYLAHSDHENVHVTLTFATSLDSQLSLAPGVQTALSGPESKAMTHYLRSKHDAILVGVNTAIADDPSLNCRIEGVGGYGGNGLNGQPRPIVLDPNARWEFSAESKVMRLAKEGKGKAPIVFTWKKELGEQRKQILESVGGWTVHLPSVGVPFKPDMPGELWLAILRVLQNTGINSLMVEGGGYVINDLLSPVNIHMVDSVIVTIAPTWLGKGGVQVCPDERKGDGKKLPVGRLKDVKWVPLGEDVVLCGHPRV